VDDSFGFQLVRRVIQICSGDDLFGAESGRHVWIAQDPRQVRGKLRSRSCESWQAPAGPVRVLFENLFQFIALHVVTLLHSRSIRPAILSWRPGVPAAPDHAEFPVRVLAAHSRLVQCDWNSRSNSSSVRQSHCAQTLNIMKHENLLISGGNCSMPVRDARGQSSRSTAGPAHRFLSAARWTHRPGSSSPPAKSPAAFSSATSSTQH